MKPLRLILFVSVFAFLLFSCKKDNNLHLDFGYAYFPGDVGRYVIYDADSIVYSEFNHDTVEYRYQLKEVIESIFPDNEGRPSARIERYYQYPKATAPYYDNVSWTLGNVCYATRTQFDLERVENNIRYVNFVFPIKNYEQWNGNAQNTLGNWEYQFNGINQPMTLGSSRFDSTVTVIQRDTSNLLIHQFYKEVYAKNAGLVYKEIFDVYDNSTNISVPVVDRILGGVHYRLTVNSCGRQ